MQAFIIETIHKFQRTKVDEFLALIRDLVDQYCLQHICEEGHEDLKVLEEFAPSLSIGSTNVDMNDDERREQAIYE